MRCSGSAGPRDPRNRGLTVVLLSPPAACGRCGMPGRRRAAKIAAVIAAVLLSACAVADALRGIRGSCRNAVLRLGRIRQGVAGRHRQHAAGDGGGQCKTDGWYDLHWKLSYACAVSYDGFLVARNDLRDREHGSEWLADKPCASLRRSNWKYDRPDPYGYSILPHVHVNRTHVQWLHAVARR